MKFHRFVCASIVLATITTVAVGCGKNNEAPAAGTPTTRTTGQQESGPTAGKPSTPNAPVAAAGDPATAEAMALFSSTCAACHGPSGKGDGAAAAALNPKPRNYADAAWQKAVTDDEIRKAILLGGQGIGKSPMMPGNPQLKDKPQVVDALVKMIRGFAG
jgi:mono/diheme cytochrome c family protein